MNKKLVIIMVSLWLSACGVKKNYVATNSSTCNSDLSGCLGLPPPPTPTPTPPGLGSRMTTVPKTMAATATARDITYNLGTELAGASFPGVSFIISVAAIQPAGANSISYVFDNPRIATNGPGGSPVHVADIRIAINGTLITNATTYATVDRYIAAAQAARTLTDGAMTVTPALNPATDQLSISFAKVEAAPGYNPPTLTQLRAATGVFGSRCISCHSAAQASGGLDLTSNASISGAARAVPFDPDNSKIIIRMLRATGDPGVMPTSGWASAAEQAAAVDAVRQWILDGAPLN